MRGVQHAAPVRAAMVINAQHGKDVMSDIVLEPDGAKASA